MVIHSGISSLIRKEDELIDPCFSLCGYLEQPPKVSTFKPTVHPSPASVGNMRVQPLAVAAAPSAQPTSPTFSSPYHVVLTILLEYVVKYIYVPKHQEIEMEFGH